MQIQLKHFLIGTAIIAATLAITPLLTAFLFAVLLLFCCVDAIMPKRRLPRQLPSDTEPQEIVEWVLLSPKLGLTICLILFLFSIGLPIFQVLAYTSTGWYLRLWLVPQLCCFAASLWLLSFVNFDSHDRYEYRVIVAIVYLVFVPVTIMAALVWRIFLI
jgi:hypothetical protein